MPRFVPNGQGKGWAKGRTATTDPRIARNAEAHRGKTYRRHKSPEQDRRHRHGTARTLPLEWSDTMAYVVGLMATDGCLYNNGRHLNFKSRDEQLVRTFLGCLGRRMRYSSIIGRTGNRHYVAQFGDVRFFRWLVEQGLHPRKSLTLGAINCPDEFLPSLLRGLLDGDGSLQNFVHAPTPSTYPAYRYERLWLYFASASREHVDWLRERIAYVFGPDGYLEVQARPDANEFYRLKFGKHASIALLTALYPTQDVPKLERKWKIWDDYARRNALP